jgi:hypothetical protein
LGFEESRARRFHSVFRVPEVEEREPWSDALELHVVELPKVPQHGSVEREAELVRWGQLLAALEDEQLEELAVADPAVCKFPILPTKRAPRRCGGVMRLRSAEH